jgi:type II secretory ATPase GspE/PulE/Tfp pilus assembly ATPase PilB-like protein
MMHKDAIPFEDALQALLLEERVPAGSLALAKQIAQVRGVSFYQALTTYRLIHSNVLARAAARASNLPIVDQDIEPSVRKWLASRRDAIVCRSPDFGVPVGEQDGHLVVAVPEPEREIDGDYAQYRCKRVIASRSTLQHLYRALYAGAERRYQQTCEEVNAYEKSGKGTIKSPLMDWLIAVMRYCAYRGASDVQWLCVGSGDDRVLQVKERRNGEYETISVLPAGVAENLSALLKQLANVDAQVQRKFYEGGISEKGAGALTAAHQVELHALRSEFDFRFSIAQAASGPTVTIRILPLDNEALDFESIEMDANDREAILWMTQQGTGVILICGPTGHGKTTLCTALMNTLDTETHSKQTLENPVEYRMPGALQFEPRITQKQSEEDGSLEIFRGMLRHSPTVISAGEIRDVEGVALLMRASSTGHLVFATNHADDAPSGMQMLVDMDGPERVADNLAGVVAVRLLRRVCPHCAVPDSSKQHHSHIEEMIRETGVTRRQLHIVAANPSGCGHCHRGYVGRFPILELLVNQSHVSTAIRERGSNAKIRAAGIPAGRSLRARALAAVLDGKTTFSEALAKMPRLRV